MFRVVRYVFPTVLILLVFVLSFVNYTPGTWLSGWDTLHPEFNFGIYFKRVIFSVWQEHQGLGAVASQAHAAELPRLALLWLSSFIFPTPFLRYFYFYLTLLLGTLGMYFVLKDIFLKDLKEGKKRAISFSGSLIYLLNLGTLQHYYVPFEIFATHFATLPYLILFATKFIENGSKKNALYFMMTTILSTSIAHTATLFYAFFLGFSLYVLTLTSFSWKKYFKNGLFILLSTIILNSFWLLPNIYFVLNHGKEVAASQIHSQFSEKAFLTGQKFGGILDLAVLKNFLFDWGEYSRTQGRFVDLFDEWSSHLANPFVIFIGLSIFTLVLLGIIVSLRAKKEDPSKKYFIALLPIFLLSAFFIANNNFFSSNFFNLLQERFILFKEALRFPFTKFSIMLMFSFAVYFSIALKYLLSIVNSSLKNEKILNIAQALVVSSLLIFYMFPAFSGNLISNSMKIKFPENYFEVFSFLNKQDPLSRIAVFPVDTFWGWGYHDWGYEGAGFRWFGAPQAFLDREFDRWSPYNEQYYWEISYAVYSQNQELFEKVLEKYQIEWLWVDTSIINPSSSKATYLDQINSLIINSKNTVLSQKFEKISLYKIENVKQVYITNNLPVESQAKISSLDRVYFDHGDYILGNSSPGYTNLFYPFRSLFSLKGEENLGFTISETDFTFSFTSKLPSLYKNLVWQENNILDKDLVWLENDDFGKAKILTRDIKIENGLVKVTFPKIGGYFGEVVKPQENLQIKEGFVTSYENCNNKKSGAVKNETRENKDYKYIRIIAQDANNCSNQVFLPNLSHKFGYLIAIKARNVEGQGLLFWLENNNSKRVDLEKYLPQDKGWKTYYFIEPPMEKDGLGFTIHLDNISIGQERTINDIQSIGIYPLPYNFLSQFYLRDVNKNKHTETKDVKPLSHSNSSFYQVEVEGKEGDILVLPQSFDKDWKAYFSDKGIFTPLFSQELKHLQISNWKNGWILNSNNGKRVVIIFLPQYLQYFGFVLTLGWILTIIFWRHKK